MTAPRSRELCIMACVFCKDAQFQAWIGALSYGTSQGEIRVDEAGAKAFILSMCKVASRNELDTDPAAAVRFHELVRLPFLAWKEAQ